MKTHKNIYSQEYQMKNSRYMRKTFFEKFHAEPQQTTQKPLFKLQGSTQQGKKQVEQGITHQHFVQTIYASFKKLIDINMNKISLKFIKKQARQELISRSKISDPTDLSFELQKLINATKKVMEEFKESVLKFMQDVNKIIQEKIQELNSKTNRRNQIIKNEGKIYTENTEAFSQTLTPLYKKLELDFSFINRQQQMDKKESFNQTERMKKYYRRSTMTERLETKSSSGETKDWRSYKLMNLHGIMKGYLGQKKQKKIAEDRHA